MRKFNIRIGNKDFTIEKFKYDKLMLIVQTVAKMADTPAFMAQGDASLGSGDPNAITALSRMLLVSGPVVLGALALSLIPDKELIRLTGDQERLNSRLDELVGLLREECDLEKYIELGRIVLACIGLDTLKK